MSKRPKCSFNDDPNAKRLCRAEPRLKKKERVERLTEDAIKTIFNSEPIFTPPIVSQTSIKESPGL